MILFILITVLFLIYVVLCWKRLDWGLAVLVCCLPIYLVRFKIGWLPSTLLEVMAWFLVLVYIIKIISGGEWKKSLARLKKLLKKWWVPILLFLVAATISVFVSEDLRHAAGRWKAYFLEPILVFLIFLDVIRSKKQVKMILWALGLSAGLISLSAILQYIFGINIPAAYGAPNLKRAVSFYGYPNAVGLYVAPIVTLFAGLLIEKIQGYKLQTNSKSQIPNSKPCLSAGRPCLPAGRQIINNKLQTCLPVRQANSKSQPCLLMGKIPNSIFCILVVLLGVGGLVLAVSKGAWVGVLVGVFFMAMFTKWRWWVVGLTVFLIVLILIVPMTRDIIWPVVTFQATSGDVRLALWEGTWNLIKANPVFGVGLAGFEAAYPGYKLNKHVEILVYPHNILLNFWVEIGLIGLISFIWLLALYFRGAVAKFKIQNSEFKIALMGAMVCLIAHGLVDVPYFKNDLAMLFWVFVGLMIVQSSKLKVES